MFSLQYILAPLIGGVIGYITNDIAIRMLFRPHTEKRLFGIKIPFTPGIIPKEKGRIAAALGDTISQNLMNQEVLQRYLLSDEMIAKVKGFVEDFFNTQKKNSESVADFLGHYLTEDELREITTSVNKNLTKQIQSKLSDSEVGKNIAHIVVENVIEKMKLMEVSEFLAGIGGLPIAVLTMLSGNIIAKFLSLLQAPAERMLANNINSMLQNNGAEMISNMLGNEVQNFMDTPVERLLENKDQQIVQIVNTTVSVYKIIITEHLPRILESIDIAKIVRERINDMDVDETEKLIFQVMNKELKAIVRLGALLGLLMGAINIFL